VKGIDSNLLVYASLIDHPASAACEQHIAAEPSWLTSVVNLIELQRVLSGVYGLTEGEAEIKLADFAETLAVESLTSGLVLASVPLRHAYGIDLNDAILLETCRRQGISVLATDDSRLAAACAALQIAVENPIDPALRAQMTQWEDQNLPAKGLPRVLTSIHRWLKLRDTVLATEFHSATQSLSRLV
jgi:predicted nucleic acid-binding protein